MLVKGTPAFSLRWDTNVKSVYPDRGPTYYFLELNSVYRSTLPPHINGYIGMNFSHLPSEYTAIMVATGGILHPRPMLLMVLEILPHETNEYDVILTCNFLLWHILTDAAMLYDIKAPDPGSVMMVAD